MRGYGGRIAIVGDPKDHSTRDLLARIRGRMNILIVRLGALGDIVHADPGGGRAAARLSRRAHRLAGRARSTARSSISSPSSIASSRSTARRSRLVDVVGRAARGAYDIALDFQGLMKSAVLARASGARASSASRSGTCARRRTAVLLETDDGTKPRSART